MKIFLSYSHLDKNLAGKIKKCLRQYGVKVFLAHDDIEPSEEWADRILEELNNCDIFMPILTKQFNESKWTDQETGCALILKKLIIPLKVDVDPHGFISRYQARTLKKNDVASSLTGVMRVISGKPRVGALLRDAAIMKFASSESFEDAKNNTERLLSLKGFSLSQVEAIMNHTIRNDQIHRCFKAQDWLAGFIGGYKDKLDRRLYKKVRNLIG
jgi:hypothetical protein